MKLSIPSSTLPFLLSSSGAKFTKSQAVLVITDSDHDMKTELDIIKHEKDLKSFRLKEKVKAKVALRKKLGLRGGYLFTSEKECHLPGTPAEFGDESGGSLVDIGVLACGNSKDVCVEDSVSSLGGVCAEVVVGDEDSEGVEQTKVGVAGKKLLPVTVKDRLKLERIQKTDVGTEGYPLLGMAECVPATQFGHVEIGVDNGCMDSGPNHVCLDDPASNLGGSCVEVIPDKENSLQLEIHPEWEHHNLLAACNYANGTSGMKCNGPRACYGLSASFIENKIGCGSCNYYGACIGLTETSSVGELSCNGGMSCRYDASLGEGDGTSSIVISDQSCNEYYACAYFLGNATVSYDACNGVYACMAMEGVSYLGEDTCNKDGACSYLTGNTTVQSKSCNDCYSCKQTSGVTLIYHESCNDLQSCSDTSGVTVVNNQSCNMPYSCSSTSGTTEIGIMSCNMRSACSNVNGNTSVGRTSCNGEKACEKASKNTTVLENACNSKSACSSASGEITLFEKDSCNGDLACYGGSADYVRVHHSGCSANYACMHLLYGTISVGEESCSTVDACKNVSGSFLVQKNSCNGQLACSYTLGILNVGDKSCDENEACSRVSGETQISTSSCNGQRACKNASEITLIHDQACNDIDACFDVSDRTTVYSHSCNEGFACRAASGVTTIHNHSCNGGSACFDISDRTTIYSHSCNEVSACRAASGETTIHDQSCNGDSACRDILDRTTIYSHSCNEIWACSEAAGNSTIHERSCNGGSACSYVSERTTVYGDSCNEGWACSEASGETTIHNHSCNDNSACSYVSERTTIYGDSCNEGWACANAAGNSTIHYHSCNGNGACRYVSGITTVYSDSCNEVLACRVTSGETTIYSQSCNARTACRSVHGQTTIQNNSCTGISACRDISGFTVIHGSSCNNNEACYGASGTTMIHSHSCNSLQACSSVTGNTEVMEGSCNVEYACSDASGNSTVHLNSCNGFHACGNMSDFSMIHGSSCNSSYACYNLSGYTKILGGSCHGVRACSDLPINTTIGLNSCVGSSACRGGYGNSEFMSISDSSCLGDDSCLSMTGLTSISENSCVGVGACARTVSSTILEGSCRGVGACSKSVDGPTPLNFTVGSNSCNGCYTCANMTGLVTIGDESCLGFTACEESSGNVSIGNQSCYGLKACSNIPDSSIVRVDSYACSGARACKSMSGYSVAAKSSCNGPRACQNMNNGMVSEGSCAGRGACYELQGVVGASSCQGYFSCKGAGALSASSIGFNSCNAAFACENNSAVIGDCLCGNDNECKNNTTPMDFDECPSFSPSFSLAPSSSLQPSNQASYVPSLQPSTSSWPSWQPSISNPPSSRSAAMFDDTLGVPRCSSLTTFCDTGTLVTGRGTMTPEEPNHSNTLDECIDGNSGYYHSDESLDRVLVRSGEIDGTGSDEMLTAGGRATIIATVYPYGDGSDDYADFFYSSDISNPNWILIGTVQPSGFGVQDIIISFTLPEIGENQAVRVQYRYKSEDDPCSSGSYNDRDDLVFAVHKASFPVTPVPSTSPSASPSASPSSTPTNVLPTVSPSKSPSNPPSNSLQTCASKVHKVKIESSTQKPIQMFEVQILSQGVYVAQDKNAIQSSTYKNNSGKFGANNAIDGVLTSFSHTDDSQSWWEVDLGDPYSIDALDIMNRWCKDASDEKGCMCRLSEASVSLLGEENKTVAKISTGNTCNMHQVHIDIPALCSTVTPTMSPSFSSCFPHARKVKLQQLISGLPIQIFELLVMSTGTNINNIAEGKSATQSSTFVTGSGKSFDASNAFDGDPTTFSHTNDADPWLEVDLEENFSITAVGIQNRWCQNSDDPKNCLCRLSGATLSLIDEFGEEISSIAIGDTCGQLNLEYVFDPLPKFCSSKKSLSVSQPSKQLIRQPWHGRVLRKRPNKC